jgi:3D (Asp-Asp-Asp) domain-containing protein
MKILQNESLFVLVDVQEKLFCHIDKKEQLEKNLLILLQGLKYLNIPMIVNEQYKKGLGDTIQSLNDVVHAYSHFEKTTFSCCGQENSLDAIKNSGKKTIIVAGIETHVCVMQTVLDLLSLGYKVAIVEDCIGSRKQNDKDIAIQRMIQAGAIPCTYESVLFELLKDSKNTSFKQISQLVK